ncbi:response regulator [Desulforegula conservatrix]|uniref:response regulator n=1 Tax=Desulforegula conservatrix TaxID=153026 RepID=UPI00041A9489|nr:response regulator [Desulforegula conservatrix]
MNEIKSESPAILIVDDEEIILRVLSRILRKEQFQIHTALSGSQALDIIKDNHIDMIICDQRMPEMSGNKFLSIVSKEKPEIIRTIFTGYTEVNSVIEAINKGQIAKFFTKPIDNDELIREIKELLKAHKKI